ncbi:outer membrane beta-barrel family protein [uncultured Alistipes sp.]|uniref:outer membrane beta-barrel family protein n=1 Tax=uncultured Alistipes sp. TaxID=538949 RepID=UPI0025F0A2E4|nr:outer membrane beta-barrel family protein [uncultured Alistipes sp.]
MRHVLIILLLSMSLPATAQRPLRGSVTDGEKPVHYATVVLLRDGQQAAGTATGEDGRFEIAADTGRYLLAVRHVGYRPFEQMTAIGTEGTDAGELQLEPASIGEVTVTAETITRQADRFVVNVNDSPELAGRDGAELLEKAPGVWLGDSGISINGAAGTKVFIDGRELKGTAEEITSYLRSLTAADIARIEVVPLAGAEFTADARGGVILVTLRRRRDNGIDGNLQATTTQGRRIESYAPSGRIGIRAGRWTLNASAAGNLTPYATSHFTESRKYSETHVPFSGVSDAKNRINYGRGHLAAIFDPNPRHTVGAEIEYTTRSNRAPSVALTTLGEAVTDSDYDQHTSRSTVTATANYIWRIDTLGSQLKLIADYTRYATDGDNMYQTTETTAGVPRDSAYRSATASTYDILTADLALTHKLNHGLTLRAGLRYTRNGMDDESRYDTKQQDTWRPLPEYGYTQRYTEHIGAAYASLGLSKGRWDASAGVRGEYTSVSSQVLDRNYFSLFPNASLTYALSDLRTWMLAAQWSRNIERPSFPALNPTRYQMSEYSWQSGNPALRPTYIHRFSLTAIWRYRYTLTVGGNLHHDLIREVAHTDQSDPDIVYIRPENHYTENHWFVAAGIPVKVTRWLNLTVNAVGVMQRIRLERNDDAATHYLMFTDATAAFTLPAGFYIEAVYRGHSRLHSGNSEVAPRHTLSATVKKQLCKKRLTLFVTATNLTGCGEEYASTTGNMRRVIGGQTGWSGRSWKIGASWNFRSGQKFKARTVESAAQAERKRLEKSEGQ